MTQPPATRPQTPPSDAQDWARPMLERELLLLGELAEIGMEVARAIGRQAKGAGEGEAAAPMAARGDIGATFARVSRAVRMTVALQASLIADLERRDKGAAFDRNLADEAEKAARRHSVPRLVHRLILDEHGLPEDREEVDALVRKSRERLADPDIYGDLLSRPIGETVAMICEDLGLSPDWRRLAHEAWAQAEIAGGAPGSPFAGLAVPDLQPSDSHAPGIEVRQPAAAAEPFRFTPRAASP